MVQLKDIAPAAANNINTEFILLEKEKKKTGGQNTCLTLVADETAAVHFQLWADECDAFQPGDIIVLTNGIFSYIGNKDLVLRAGKRGRIEKIGEFNLAYVETPNMSEIEWVADPKNNKFVRKMTPPEDCRPNYSRIFPPQH